MTLTFSSALACITSPAGMSSTDTAQVLDLLMSGTLAPEHGAELLATWSRRGETGVELAAVVNGLLSRAERISVSGSCFDVCGTGGSRLTRFNVSTTVAFILAAAGVPVVKHGNKGSARPNGSFDLLEALHIPYQLPPTALTRLHQDTRLCFLFARAMHPGVAAVAPYRKIAAGQVKRTVFNLAGPLANPCRPRAQIIGVTDERTAAVVAEALGLLGVERAVVVRGHPGIDEISVTGPTQWWDVHAGRTATGTFTTLHIPSVAHEQIPGGDAPENAVLFQRLLQGTECGPLLEMVVANAGVALDCWGGIPIAAQGPGITRARELVASGQVWQFVERFRSLTQQLVHSAHK